MKCVRVDFTAHKIKLLVSNACIPYVHPLGQVLPPPSVPASRSCAWEAADDSSSICESRMEFLASTFALA